MNHPAFATPAPQRQAAILIVDDAPASLGLLQDILRNQGYRTFVATSGERALDLAQRLQPDLILLDVMLPGLDGLETCSRLKTLPRTADIPVIFVSACSDTDDIVAGFDRGAADYIAKPLRLPEVCARVRAQLQMRAASRSNTQQVERLRMIVDGMDEGLMLLGQDGRIQYANPASQRCLGTDARDLAGRGLAELLAEPSAQEIESWFDTRDTGAPGQARSAREVLVRHPDGSLRPMDLSLSPMASSEQLWVALLHDISHHKQSENALQRAALADPLTGIANRRHFDACLEREWQRAIRVAKPISLLVLDVDHFKLYNDLFGHAAGDQCLQAVASTLQSHALRATDLAARYGGEEFVLLLPDTSHGGAAKLAESIRHEVERLRVPNPRSTTSGFVTVSVGAATFVPSQFDDIRSLFLAADRAMYDAKAAGRNSTKAVEGGFAWEAMQQALAR
ncbi:diguanylate cyclase [Massilia yuzhufengensis]|uniref:diguanylate cyclase n=1 Tax=Massilia yuzhufengensis TaxID=1164594 RepID=A0A1I1SHU1_9BURK|nr:diguanylate cyclase [Massilia yuzhufengensis]SFD46047.1 response regulator receiver modulated diguanylate cyclase [Massilia yuzhufengensis]